MLNVLIVTYYCTNNYGSFLQAWSLGKFLEKEGCLVTYWGSESLEAQNVINENNKYRVERDLLLKKAREEFTIDYTCNEEYDLVVVGSDVIWASTKIKEFWGHNLKAKKYISYAASMWGMVDSDNIPLKIRKCVEKIRLLSERKQLKRFSGISVRDSRTEKAIRALVGKRPEVVRVLDPTFLMENIPYIKRIIPENYVLVYSYALVGEDINPVIEYARKHECKICLIGYRAVWADYNPAVTPVELLSLFRDAEVVFTTTFHGTALSIINHCNFVTYNSNKARQLLEELGLEARMVDSDNALDVIEKKINYKKVDSIIDSKRKKSIEYLEAFITLR